MSMKSPPPNQTEISKNYRTLEQAAAELADRAHQSGDQQHWMDWLTVRMKNQELPVRDGHIDPEDVNNLLRADAVLGRGTIRLASPVEDALDEVGWFDSTMHADQWFAMTSVSPREAASLLCQCDPLDANANPELTSNGETNPADFSLLVRVFEDEASKKPGPRALADWIDVARSRGCRVHSWLHAYLSSIEMLGGRKSPSALKRSEKVWTDERKAEVRAYRDAHGLKATAEHYKVSQATISKHVPAGKPAKQSLGPWGALAKPGKK
jgi:hypothetical protein